jgi:hypothetical protein
MVLEIIYWGSAILDGYERPLSYGSKGFREVDMRNDFWFRDALMRQRRNDRPIHFLSWNRLLVLRTHEVWPDNGAQEKRNESKSSLVHIERF